MIYYLYNNELKETSAIFRISGPDANTYLQGQFTQDLKQPAGALSYGLWLNQKGKILADSHVLRLGESEFLIVCHALSACALRERLEAYLIADDVTLLDETGQWERLAVWGDEDGLSVLQLERPAQHRFIRQPSGIIVFSGRLPGAIQAEVLVPAGGATELRAALDAMGAQRVDASAVARHRILAGIPAIPADLGAGDLPQEGGLDAAAVSYTKGCFLGQEVMARIKNLGQVRRALHLVRGSGAAPAPASPLYQAEQRVGEIRSVAPDGEGFVAMAMLSLVNYQPAAGLALAAAAPPTIEVLRRV